MRKRIIVFVAVIILLLGAALASADRIPPERSERYIGAMRVVKCNEYVSLREQPYKTTKALARVPLGAIVYNCSTIPQKKSFVYAEYEGISGYILVKYLEKAPEFEPAVTSAITKKMTMEELIGDAEIVLDWKDYNISVVAAHEFITEKGIRTEVLRVGCFIDGEPLWGHVETLQTYNDLTMLRAFIGGTEEDPMVMLYDGGYGLTMMDLLSGSEKWTLNTGTLNLGDAAAVAVNDENGIMYIAGTDGPDPVAITQEGRILWQSRPNDPELTEPCEIILKNDRILVRYKCGRADGYQTAMFDLTGEIIRIEGKQE